MSDILARKTRVGIYPQGTFGTAISANEDYETLLWDALSVVPESNAIVSSFDLTSSLGLVTERARTITDRLSELKRMGFSAPADRYNLALYFVAALQKVTEINSTPFQKVITPLALTTVPNFVSSNVSTGAYLYTLIHHSTGINDAVRMGTAIIDQLNFVVDFLANGVARYAQINGQWVGTTINENGDPGGTWTNDSGVNYYNSGTKMQVNIAGAITASDICVRNYQLSINNNVTSDCKTTGGQANNFKIAPTYQVTLDIPYNSATYLLLEDYLVGTETTITLTTGTTGQAGFLEIVAKGRIAESPLSYSGDYRSNNLVLNVEQSSGSALTVTMADAVDRNYPAP